MKDFAQTGRRTKRYAESMPTIADDGFRVEKAVEAEPRFQTTDDRTNPLADLIGDDVYELLLANGLLYEKGVRDYQIRAAYRQMRQSKVAASEAIEQLRAAHPYLQYDTVRKIVYARNR